MLFGSCSVVKPWPEFDVLLSVVEDDTPFTELWLLVLKRTGCPKDLAAVFVPDEPAVVPPVLPDEPDDVEVPCASAIEAGTSPIARERAVTRRIRSFMGRPRRIEFPVFSHRQTRRRISAESAVRAVFAQVAPF